MQIRYDRPSPAATMQHRADGPDAMAWMRKVMSPQLLPIALLTAACMTATAAGESADCKAAGDASLRALEQLNSTITTASGCAAATHGQVCQASGVSERCEMHPDCGRGRTSTADACAVAGATPECCVSFYHQECEAAGGCRTVSNGMCHQSCALPESGPPTLTNAVPGSASPCADAAAAALDALAAVDPNLATTAGCANATTGIVCGVSAQLGECAPGGPCDPNATATSDACAVHAGRCCVTYFQKECSARGMLCAVKPTGMCFLLCDESIPTRSGADDVPQPPAPAAGARSATPGVGAREGGLGPAAVGGILGGALVLAVVGAALVAVFVMRRRRDRRLLQMVCPSQY